MSKKTEAVESSSNLPEPTGGCFGADIMPDGSTGNFFVGNDKEHYVDLPDNPDNPDISS